MEQVLFVLQGGKIIRVVDLAVDFSTSDFMNCIANVVIKCYREMDC